MAGSMARHPFRIGILALLLAALIAVLLFLQFTVFNSTDDAAITEQGGQVKTVESDNSTGADGLPAAGQESPANPQTTAAATAPSGGPSRPVSLVTDTPVPVSPLPAPAPLPQSTGAIFGLVQNGSAAPAENIQVYLFDANGDFTGEFAVSDVTGWFSFQGLAAGVYRLYFYDPSGFLQPAWYGSEGSPTGTTIRLGTAEQVSVTQSLRSAANPLYGAISGQVTDECIGIPFAPCGVGIYGVTVSVYLAGGQTGDQLTLVGTAVTDGNGDYHIGNLPSGDYKVFFQPPAGSYTQQWYRGQTSRQAAEIVPVLPSETVGKVDAVLTVPGGTISGTVTAGSKALPMAKVDIFNEAGVMAGSYLTDSQGRYRTTKLPVRTYRVRVSPPSSDLMFEWYEDEFDFVSASPVPVLDGQDTGGIDIDLAKTQVTVNSPAGDGGEVLAATTGAAIREPEGQQPVLPPAAVEVYGDGGSGQDGITVGQGENAPVSGEDQEQVAVQRRQDQPLAGKVQRDG